MDRSTFRHSAPDQQTARPAAPILVRDPWVRLQILTFAVVALFYGLPLASPARVAAFSWTWLSVAFMTWPVLGCFVGLDRLERPSDRRFWVRAGLAFSAWLAALVLYALTPEDAWSVTIAALMDLLYLAFYALLYIAVDRRPDSLSGARRSRLERSLRTLGIVAFGVGWTMYFVIVPTWFGGYGLWPTSTEGLMFVLLDAALLARLLAARQQAATPDWARTYGLLAMATLFLLGTDSLGLFESFGVTFWPDGSLPDLLWALPGSAYLVAVRARHLPSAATVPAEPAPDELSLTRVGMLLLVGALSFPVLHVLFEWLQVLPAQDQALLRGLLAVVFAGTTILATLAVVAHYSTARDVLRVRSERKALEAQLLQAQKMEAIGRMAGGVAHDFNNLLTAITGYTDLVLENLSAFDSNRSMLEEVRGATNKAASLVRQLLAFSRRQALIIEPLDANRLVGEMQNMMQRVVGGEIRLETRLAEGLRPILASGNQLEQVVLNLVVNARDAMLAGGLITVTTEAVDVDATIIGRLSWLKPGPYVRLTVTDTGAGISSEVLPYIFDPFFTTKERDKGTGLGLSMVYGTMRQFGGAVDVETRMGAGTTFSLLLPTAEPSMLPAAPPVADTGGEDGTETVLLAEDDEHVRALARKILTRRGYRVIEGDTSAHAAELAETHPETIDLLLTDVIMPELNGPELAERVLRARGNVRVLFMSGYTDSIQGPNGRLIESGDFILKPFTPPALARAVRRALDRARPPAA